ncbi:AAA family ATPase [Rhodocytophaga rosea]|uniref:AAA family ATPase n=1 Tax=Rhodocytophaga rosea TaxID=2704465 RepID=A0A6C0GKX4_9BACT|nr:AAA family ATPase [Rhodocytophaga rosea]QHT68696.1 AAA family ATPase [Rhodocytophaga rosea]
MFIKSVILNNYRIYHKRNKLDFFQDSEKNVFLISGNNGFGKTTFLTSLVWCLYGKLMVDVDEKYRREIYEAGGYKKYASSILNRKTKAELIGFQTNYDANYLAESKNNNREYHGKLEKDLIALSSFSVKIIFSDIHIPSIPCSEVSVERTFNILKEEDDLQVFIDGAESELTREVGLEIFIQDFVLPKEIAKFFFFDAEKIVSLAEMKSIEEKQSLSRAYSEVLGIKKYEDLKYNLEDLRIRFRRNSASEHDKRRFAELQKEVDQYKRLIEEYDGQITILQEEKLSKKQVTNQYQEKLIREGNSLTVEDLIKLKATKKKLEEEGEDLKSRMKDLLELAPFAITGIKMQEVRSQLISEMELDNSQINPFLINEKAKSVAIKISSEIEKLNLSSVEVEQLVLKIQNAIINSFTQENISDSSFKVLLEFTDKEKNEFEAIFSNLKHAYNQAFKQLVTEYKNNKIFFNKITRKISDAESKENDLLIQEIRKQKSTLDRRIKEIDDKLLLLSQEIGGLQREVAIKSKLISEIAKKINIEISDQAKDETAARLIGELDIFITNLKNEKKSSLEVRIKEELNALMHKSDFVSQVKVDIGQNIIDISLYDQRRQEISKDGLSKGEQQLYATALLKALVDESNIEFPIFIDSPLQKFDKKHSHNIIAEFYPKVSKQVVLFPLLEKELTEEEFQALYAKVNNVYLIKNVDYDHSTFIQVKPEELFANYKEMNEYVQ